MSVDQRLTATASRPTRASLSGAFTGTIRHPYAEMAPDTYVFGMADVVVVNYPIAGQGANNAAHCAGIYLKTILDRPASRSTRRGCRRPSRRSGRLGPSTPRR